MQVVAELKAGEMDKREQVFVSSTFVDLRDEREKVIQGLLEADCFPAGMELFPATNDEKWELIQGVIDDSDYYLLILGGRYGSEDDETQLSYTEMEFDYAVKQGKPVMSFVHGAPDSIPVGNTDKDSKKAAKLDAFRDKVQKKMVKPWTAADQLPGYVAQALMKTRKSYPAVGWVRGDQAMTPEMRAEMAELRARIAELEAAKAPAIGPIYADLAGGEDRVEYEFRLTYRSAEGSHQATEYVDTVTWDQIFTALGPRLLHETTEGDMNSTLRAALVKLAEDELTPESVPDDFESLRHIELINTGLTDKARIQLMALGLIERGTQKRTISDKGRYWKLTQVGEDRLMQMKAVRTQDKTSDFPVSREKARIL
ncbi:hypothetical protein ABIB29_003553 [Arthrobacter sp. UYEF36]